MMVADYVPAQSTEPGSNAPTIMASLVSPTASARKPRDLNPSTWSDIEPNQYISIDQANEPKSLSEDGERVSNCLSPNTENCPPTFDVNGQLQRKELFTHRKQREFIPDNKKDESYWDRRRRNNEAAKRSREKRRYNDMILEQRVVELSKENHYLKSQLAAIKEKFNIQLDTSITVDRVMAVLPRDPILNTIKMRSKNSSSAPPKMYPSLSVSIPNLQHSNHSLATPNSGPSPSYNPSHTVYPEPPENYDADNYTPFPFTPVLPPLNPPILEAPGNIALNLSRGRPHNYPLQIPCDSHQSNPDSSTTNYNNLPLKLRHKSHLGDRDISFSQFSAIKQEPCPRSSPPWDGEGSSDERDSGISIGADWIPKVPSEPAQAPNETGEYEHENAHLKSEVARLASEVANLKNILSGKKTTTEL